MEKITFEFAGLTLLEPLSTLMNWVLATQCFLYFRALRRIPETGSFHRYWAWFFLAYAVSLIFGGSSHLFYEYLGMAGKIPGWSIALLGVVFGELAMIADISDRKKKATLLAVIRGKLFATIILLVYDFSFKWIMVHTSGLFLFVGFISFSRWRAGTSSYRYFLFGICSLLLMAIVKVAGVDIHPAWFNRDDIAHLLMLLAYWLFFKAVKGIISE